MLKISPYAICLKMSQFLIRVVFYLRDKSHRFGLPRSLLLCCTATIFLEWTFINAFKDFCVPVPITINFFESRESCFYSSDFTPVNATRIVKVLPATDYGKYYHLLNMKLLFAFITLNLYHIIDVQKSLMFKNVIRLSNSLRDMHVTLRSISFDLMFALGTYRDIYRVFLILACDFTIYIAINFQMFKSLECINELDIITEANIKYKNNYLVFAKSPMNARVFPKFLSKTRCLERRDFVSYLSSYVVLGIMLFSFVFVALMVAYRTCQWLCRRSSTFNRLLGPPVGEYNIEWLCQRQYLSWMYLDHISTILLPPEIEAIASELYELL